MTDTLLYKTTVNIKGGRNGNAKSEDEKLDVQLDLPASMGGKGEGTNPEQLFAAAYGACFVGALRLVASKEKINLNDPVTIKTNVSLSKDDQDNFVLSVIFDIKLPETNQEDAEKLVRLAHEVCPFSRATRNNIEIIFNIETN